MAKRPPLTVVGFLCMPDGSKKPIEELTKEEREDWERRTTKRIGRVMSEYYRLHPEEMESLEDVSPERQAAFYAKYPEEKENRCYKAADT